MNAAVNRTIELLGPGDWQSRMTAEQEAVYVWEPKRGGRALIVGPDGSVLAAASSTSPGDHERAFANGERTPESAFASSTAEDE